MTVQFEEAGATTAKIVKYSDVTLSLRHLGGRISISRQRLARPSRCAISETSRFRSPHYTFSENSNAKFPKMLCSRL
jgi:hypothetical protein